MNNLKNHIELRKYTVQQLLEYINEQSRAQYPSRPLMDKLSQGIVNICQVAFGMEYEKVIKSSAPRILRAALNGNQLGLGGRFRRFIDRANVRSDSMIAMIINEITSAKLSPQDINNRHKAPWLSRMHDEKKVQETERVK